MQSAAMGIKRRSVRDIEVAPVPVNLTMEYDVGSRRFRGAKAADLRLIVSKHFIGWRCHRLINARTGVTFHCSR
jgi:hypothetical protein